MQGPLPSLLGGLLAAALGCAGGPSESRSPRPGADLLPPPGTHVEVGVPPEIAEGTYFIAGVVESITAPADVPVGVFDVVISAGEPTPACQIEVRVPERPGPLRVGVDGVRAERIRLYVGPAEAPPLAVGERICGLVDRDRLPPFFTRVEVVLVDAEGVVRLVTSSSLALQVPGWSFERGPVIGSRRVEGGVARWRRVDASHQGATVEVGLGEWPVLEAGGHRFRIFALAYEKDGRLVPEEAPRIDDFAILWIGRAEAK